MFKEIPYVVNSQVTSLAVEVAYVCLDHDPTISGFLALDNAHNLLRFTSHYIVGHDSPPASFFAKKTYSFNLPKTIFSPSIPAGIFGIYFFNIFMSLIGGGMGEHPKKNLGFIVLLQYILFDCLKLFVSFLLGGQSGHLVPIAENKKCFRHQHDQLCNTLSSTRTYRSHAQEYNQGNYSAQS